MISLSVNSVSYSVGVKDIIKDVSFSIENGDRLGIVGVNGSGKTTLLKLIVGEISADSGEIYIARDKCVGMLGQNDAFFQDGKKDETVLSFMYGAFPRLRENEKRLSEIEKEMEASEERAESLAGEYDRINRQFLADGGLHYKSRCKSILEKLGFPEETHSQSVASLSGGQKTRLYLAGLLFREPDILILDEPTNHLDLDTMIWLEGVLSNYKKTLIVVSHDRYFLDKITNKTLDIENHKAELYKCAYTEFVQRKKENRAAQEKKYNLQQKEIARLEAFIEQQKRWNREKNIIAAESRQKAIDRMDKVDKPENEPQAIRLAFDEGIRSGNDVLSVKNLSMAFGENKLFQNLSFEIKSREKLFVVGKNGCGKSTLLKILLSRLEPESGKFQLGYNVNIGYYDQENQNLDNEKTVLEELWSAYPNMTQTYLRTTLASFCFRGDDIEKTVSVLSGGERARLTLAKLILSKMNFLILDEPTNHLDIPSREALENALLAYEGTILAVSHDRYFIKKLASRVIDISESPVKDFRGGYAEYAEFLENTQTEGTVKEENISDSKLSYLKQKEENAKQRKNEARKKKIALEISETEKKIDEISAKLFGEAATDYVRAAELDREKTELEEKLLSLYEEEEKLAY